MNTQNTILIVDPDIARCQSLSNQLKIYGHLCSLCHNTQQALDFVASTTCLAVFLILDHPAIDYEEIMYFVANTPETKLWGMLNTNSAAPTSPFLHGIMRYPLKSQELPEALKDSLSQPTQSSMPTLDHGILQSIVQLGGDDDPYFLTSLIQIFYDRFPIISKDLRDALNHSDAAKLERAAHALKGSSGNVGAVKLSRACEELETLARSGTTAGGYELWQKIQDEFEKARDELERDWILKVA